MKTKWLASLILAAAVTAPAFAQVGIYIGHDQMVEAPFTGARVRISYAFRPDYAGATRPAG